MRDRISPSYEVLFGIRFGSTYTLRFGLWNAVICEFMGYHKFTSARPIDVDLSDIQVKKKYYLKQLYKTVDPFIYKYYEEYKISKKMLVIF